MIPLVSLPVAPHAMLALLQFIEQAEPSSSPGELADQAILDWRASRRVQGTAPARLLLRGYQWKCLFLPEGTRLRVWCRSEHGYAEVIGDKLMYKGRSVSPNQFVAACSDTVRNAWVEINVLMPGEKSWKLASVRRREILAATKLAQASIPSAITATTAAAAPITAPMGPAPSPAAKPHGGADDDNDDGFGNPLRPTGGRPALHAQSASHAMAGDCTGGRRGACADRRDPHAPLDRREFF